MKKVALWLVIIFGIGFGVYKSSIWFVHKIIGNPRLIIKTDPVFAPSSVRIIEQLCVRYFSPWSNEWMSELKKQVPLIGCVTSIRSGDSVLITVAGVQLVMRINDDFAVDMMGQVYPVTQINQEVFNQLKKIILVKKADIFEPEFKLFMQTMPEFVKQEYNFVWKSPHEIYLMPIIGGSPSIIRYDKIPTQSQLALGQQLVEENKNKKQIQRSVDFRFTDQIVLSVRQLVH